MRAERRQIAAPSHYHPALHIRLFAGHQRIREDLLERRSVTVGRAPGNTLVLPDDSAPPTLPLFHRRGAGYWLHYTDRTQGSVAWSPSSPACDLSAMHALSSAHRHGYDLPLPEGTHGRVEVGRETLEFDVVTEPDPPVARSRWIAWSEAAALGLLGVASLAALFQLMSYESRQLSPTTTAAIRLLPEPDGELAFTAERALAAAPWRTIPTVPARATPALERRAVSPTASPRAAIPPTAALRDVGALPAIPVPAVETPRRGPEWALGAPDFTEDGLLRPDALLRELGEAKGSITAAYQEALRSNPALSGDVVVRLRLDADGRVGHVGIVRDTLGSAEVRRRIAAVLSGWRAPLPPRAAAEYELPFVFRPNLLPTP
jgi:hypothetical protein